jgi:uncharacterized protein
MVAYCETKRVSAQKVDLSAAHGCRYNEASLCNPGTRMNLIRLLVLGLIFWLLYRMIHRLLNKPKVPRDERRQVGSTDMVRCAHCGIHIPKNEALQRDGRDYCSAAHRDAGPSD